jgi:drug/metabolite transporter (DMT)-like permease
MISFAAMCGLFVIATTKTEAANAIFLQYVAPFWVMLLAPWVIGERARRTDWLVMPIAMLGVGIIVYYQVNRSGAGLMLAIGAGMAFAFVMMTFRKLRAADAVALPCLVNLATALLLAIPAIARPDMAPLPAQASTWMWLALMGVVQMALPYWLLSLGLRHVSASDAALITLSEPIMNTTWTWLVIHEAAPPSTLVGGGLIVAALLVKNRLDRRARPALPRLPT